MHTRPVEGINNHTTVIKPIAYGYRDDAYFSLKIQETFARVGEESLYASRVSGTIKVRQQVNLIGAFDLTDLQKNFLTTHFLGS